MFFMSVAELKAALLRAIDKIEDKQQLEEIFAVVNSHHQASPLTEEEEKILEERHAKYLSGESKPIPFEEVQAQMRKKYGF
jgi:hypothetical protein